MLAESYSQSNSMHTKGNTDALCEQLLLWSTEDVSVTKPQRRKPKSREKATENHGNRALSNAQSQRHGSSEDSGVDTQNSFLECPRGLEHFLSFGNVHPIQCVPPKRKNI